ncbi:uncharacterized protein HD556DRAFT_1302609 [Suillus plorans]|uniref:Uncharacterized protein n=1 Tax=Suillus plorans TaxID=116603 RepID=A0A9P7J9L0_9AGAM|nr:uncharacterized protein HD556DRAFT_1302609 [Suillus plorans]KAG1810271.1 hypothetical protein HD556DRAFT_1302609 [Suillus plorans]
MTSSTVSLRVRVAAAIITIIAFCLLLVAVTETTGPSPSLNLNLSEPESLPGSPSISTVTSGIMPPQRRLPIEYDCDACGAHNVDAIRLTRHRNQCKAVRTRARRAYEKSLKLDKKRLAAKARAKAEKLAYVTAASHPMPNATQTLTSRTAIGNSSQASAYLGEGSSRDPQALIHPAPEVDLGEGSSKSPLTHSALEALPRLTPPPPPASSSSLEHHMDTSTCVQEDICDFDMYYASHSPPPQSPSESVAQSPLIPPSQVKRIRKPARVRAAGFDDPLPEGPGPLEADGSGCVEPEVVAPPEPIENVDPQTPAFCLRRFLIRIPEIVRTLPNAFGLTRLYRGRPTRIPDLDSDLNDLTATNLQTLPAITDKSISDIISPYPNENAFNFGRWYWNTTRQSKSTRQELLDNVILRPGFDPEDLRGVNFDKIDKQLAQDLSSPLEGNGWRNDPITVNIPTSQKATKASKKKDRNTERAARVHDEVDEEAGTVGTRNAYLAYRY